MRNIAENLSGMENMPGQKERRAIFFDRDGVINEDYGYVYRVEDFKFKSGLFEFLKFCKESGYLLIVVTNQSGIGRGYYSEDDFKKLMRYMQSEIERETGFCFDGIYFCSHSPDANCGCRKPNIGMVESAKGDFRIDLGSSILIGDKISDMECARNSGVRGKLFLMDGGLEIEAKMAEVKKNLEEKNIFDCHIICNFLEAADIMKFKIDGFKRVDV